MIKSKYTIGLILFLCSYGLQSQTWNTQKINPGSINSKSIFYKKDGSPVIAYHNGSTMYASMFNGTSWTTKNIFDIPGGGSSYFLSYYMVQIDTLYYFYSHYYSNSSGFGSSFIVFDSYFNNRILTSPGHNVSSMSVGGTNYILTTIGVIVYKFDLSNEVWESLGSFDGSPGVETPNSIGYGSDNKIWVPYRSNSVLKLARSKTDGTWDTWFIDSSGDVGSFAQIQVEGTSIAHITYYDNTNKRLKYAKFVP